MHWTGSSCAVYSRPRLQQVASPLQTSVSASVKFAKWLLQRTAQRKPNGALSNSSVKVSGYVPTWISVPSPHVLPSSHDIDFICSFGGGQLTACVHTACHEATLSSPPHPAALVQLLNSCLWSKRADWLGWQGGQVTEGVRRRVLKMVSALLGFEIITSPLQASVSSSANWVISWDSRSTGRDGGF